MKLKLFLLLLATGFVFQACGPKPQYKTAEGKRKLKYYNSVQFQEPSPEPMPKPKP